jgi:hypothetical protein
MCAAPLFAQSETISAERVIANYMTAIGGAEKLAAITTFSEKADLSGRQRGPGAPFNALLIGKDHETFEFYFKSPNLRFAVVLRQDQRIESMYGCDGTTSWYIGPDAVRHEYKPTVDNQYECKNGYEPMPVFPASSKVRLQMKGKKRVGDRFAWAIRAEEPKSASAHTYYFDAQTFLLLRDEFSRATGASNRGGLFRLDRYYSDYREIGGIKIPFITEQESESSSSTTILQEVEINTPIENARFDEPKIKGDAKNRQVLYNNTSGQAEVPAASAPSTLQNLREIFSALTFPDTQIAPRSAQSLPADSVSPSAGANTGSVQQIYPEPAAEPAPETSYSVVTTFVTASPAALVHLVHELKGLKPASNQQPLTSLLDKVGARTVELSRKMPNLISHEQVVQSQPGSKPTTQSFSYLTLAHKGKDAVTLDEFRVDLKTGATLETGSAEKSDAPNPSASQLTELKRATERANAPGSAGGPPLSLGFASMWVRFYPSNRSESSFRYLGQQKIDGRRTYVLAFVQKRGSVRLPGELRFRDQTIVIYYQGIAWVDESDFRILRLRMDVLPASDVPVTQLTAEIQFADTLATGFTTPLWLPREVLVTTQINGNTFRNKHSYSNYRSFQAHSRILLGP